MPRAVMRKDKRGRWLLVVMEVIPDPDQPGAYIWRCHECKEWARFASKRDVIRFSPRHASSMHRAFNTQQWKEIYPW